VKNVKVYDDVNTSGLLLAVINNEIQNSMMIVMNGIMVKKRIIDPRIPQKRLWMTFLKDDIENS
jgi:hypothetical protein